MGPPWMSSLTTTNFGREASHGTNNKLWRCEYAHLLCIELCLQKPLCMYQNPWDVRLKCMPCFSAVVVILSCKWEDHQGNLYSWGPSIKSKHVIILKPTPMVSDVPFLASYLQIYICHQYEKLVSFRFHVPSCILFTHYIFWRRKSILFP